MCHEVERGRSYPDDWSWVGYTSRNHIAKIVKNSDGLLMLEAERKVNFVCWWQNQHIPVLESFPGTEYKWSLVPPKKASAALTSFFPGLTPKGTGKVKPKPKLTDLQVGDQIQVYFSWDGEPWIAVEGKIVEVLSTYVVLDESSGVQMTLHEDVHYIKKWKKL